VEDAGRFGVPHRVLSPARKAYEQLAALIIHKLNFLNVCQTPAQCHRDDQNYGDPSEIAGPDCKTGPRLGHASRRFHVCPPNGSRDSAPAAAATNVFPNFFFPNFRPNLYATGLRHERAR
jgi:hypothetical protein